MLEVARGKDPASERKAERTDSISFAQLHERYVEEYAKKHNKSWKQAANLVKNHLTPKWKNLDAKNITRLDADRLISKIQAPVVANQTKAAGSAIFSWGIKKDLVTINPFRLIDTTAAKERERVLSESEYPKFWQAFDQYGETGKALKIVMLSGARPGEVTKMRYEHLIDGWWQMPGDPIEELGWPGTKNGSNHRVWISKPALELIGDGDSGFVLRNGNRSLDEAMRKICQQLGITDSVRPHDLRRSHGSLITGLGFGREAMDRALNHKRKSVTDVYDRHSYAKEDQHIAEAVGEHIMNLVAGKVEDNVVPIRKSK